MSMDATRSDVTKVRGWLADWPILLFAMLVRVLAWLGQLATWMIREGWYRPRVALGVALSIPPAVWITPLAGLFAFAAASVAYMVWRVREFGRASGASSARALGPTLADLVKQTWRSWQLRRKFAKRAAGFLRLVDDQTGLAPKPRRWSIDSRVRASFVVNMTKVNPYIEQLAGEPMVKLAEKLAVRSVRIETVRPGLARFIVYWGSRLDESVPLAELPEPMPGWAYFGIGEDSQPAGISLEHSVLLIGLSRSGKSTAIWALACSAQEQALLPGGEPVEFWVLDETQTEFAQMRRQTKDPRPQFGGALDGYRYATTQKQGLALLRLLDEERKSRAATMANDDWRKLKPTKERPRIILIVDELLRLIDKSVDRNDGSEAIGRMLMVLTQCAKYGIHIWSGSQAGQAELLVKVRDHFPQRICFATATEFATDAALGSKSYAQGAMCHKLSVSRDAGKGWMWDPKEGQLFPFRGVWVDNKTAKAIGRGDIPDELLAARGKPTAAESRPGAVYVMWGWPDESGFEQCLYVGRTRQPKPRTRWRVHLSGRQAKDWDDEVGRIEVRDLGSEAAAMDEEIILINELDPVYNENRYPNRYLELTGKKAG